MHTAYMVLTPSTGLRNNHIQPSELGGRGFGGSRWLEVEWAWSNNLWGSIILSPGLFIFEWRGGVHRFQIEH